MADDEMAFVLLSVTIEKDVINHRGRLDEGEP